MRPFVKRLRACLLALLAAAFLGFAGWSLIDGEITESRSTMGANQRAHVVTYTRADDPGDYWPIVGALLLFGVLLALVALAEFRNPAPGRRPASRDAARRAALTRHRRMLDALVQRGQDLYQRRAQAEALDPAVRAAMDEVIGALGRRLAVAGLGWRDLPDACHPEQRALYVVFRTPADLELSAAQAAPIEKLVREALARHGYPAGRLAQVSVHLTCAGILNREVGNDGAGGETPRPTAPGDRR